YGKHHALRITNIRLFAGDAGIEVPSIGDTAIHHVAYLGDASGSRDYSGLDASLISRVVVGIDSGFDAYPLVDPRIVMDTDRDGDVTVLDVSNVARKAAGLPQPNIPDL